MTKQMFLIIENLKAGLLIIKYGDLDNLPKGFALIEKGINDLENLTEEIPK